METSLRLRLITIILFLQFLTLPTLHTNFCTGDSAAQVRCIQSERVALLEFKQDLQDPSHRLASWATGDGDCCQWVGVVCHNVTGHVQELHLRSFPPVDDGFMSYDEWEAQFERSIFGGKINPSLLDLKHLIYLDLSYNNFNGTQIPKFLGSMERLRYLNLSYAGFGGVIPHQHGNLSNLIYLDLSYNNFNGTQIPKFLDSMERLRYLDLSNAGFGGLIPHQLGNLSNLHYLNLEDYSYNLYVMNLQWLSGLPLLQHLDMSHVNLSQASDWLPDINKLPSLLELRMSGCYLSGSTSSTPSINFSSLATLDLSYNLFENTSNILWVFGLHNLVSLDLSGNQFQGPIPVDLQNMTSLRHLDLSDNVFNSSIPNWLYSFSRLEFLHLSFNNLQGTISSSIENLTSAISIGLSYNELGGKVPRSLGNLCNLREIRLSGNKWSQEISEVLESLSKCVSNGLEILNLYNANLSGHLTDEIEQFKNLVRLDLGANSILGPIPASIGNLSSLRFLYLDSNMLEGVVSEVHFANLTKLIVLLASQNRLTLEVREDWIPPFKLVVLFLGSWNLGLKFPSWLCAQNHLGSLDISNTGILDVVPHSFWNLSSQFSYLNFSHNQIYGEIPNIPVILSVDSAVIDMSSNLFTGLLPYIFSNVSFLDLSNNLLSGSISHFLCYKMNESKQMEFLNLGKNLLSGEISNCWMMWTSLNALNLGNNNFTGSIPTSIGSLIRLSYLHLYNNKFSGKLPSTLKNCTELVTIDIAENEFVGSIPSWIGHRLSSLVILNLHSNNFHGCIPKELCSLTSLQILDLSHNKLFGRIPRCVNNFSAMTANHNSSQPFSLYGISSDFMSVPFESELLVIKGNVLEYSTTLRLVNIIDLSKNNLSGQIPKEVTSLQGLQSLNLSFNSLNGRIPENIGDMGSLESIDFSVNQLSGQVPQSMPRLTFLSHLNLSNNHLIGRIPSSTQLQSLDASSFVGNKLCGPPLANNCTINFVKPNTENERSKDFGGLEVDWFYVSMALGFVVGFWVVWGPLLMNKHWRFLYFQFLDRLGNKLRGVVS